jgi:hypothetical protein
MSLWNPSARDSGRPSGYHTNVGNPALNAACKILTPAAFRISARGPESRSVLYDISKGTLLRACGGKETALRRCRCHSDTREDAETIDKPTDFWKYAVLRARFEYYDEQIFLLSTKWRSREQTACEGSASHSFIYSYEYFASINTYSFPITPHYKSS